MSLFNPWVLLGIFLAVASSFGTGYLKGTNDQNDRQKLEIAALNEDARQKEQVLITAVQNQSLKLQKANQNAKLLQQKRNSDIDSGALKLRIAVKASGCPVQASSDTELTSGDNSGSASAELDPEVGKALFDIASEGDAAIRKLAICVNLYNEAREMINEKK